ncbi:MAG: hypothetical protein P8099_08130 [Gemmatimonadota bacterium]|jgi:hypothetical protein
MKVTRRQSLVTVATMVGGVVLQTRVLGRFRLLPRLLSKRHSPSGGGTSGVAHSGPSRNVQPALYSVKRHG